MSLNGTLETFALPDVLALLSATKKTGELQVNGGRGPARVWLDKGEMIGADVPRATTFVDALFEMLRLTSGEFAFENDRLPASPSGPEAVEPLLLEAQSRLGEWKSIEAVVPSLACAVTLAAEVSGAQVSISAEQWRTLVAVARNRDVEGVMGTLGLGEFDSCRMLKDLVQIGLVSVGDAPPAEAEAKAPATATGAVEDEANPEHHVFQAPSRAASAFQPTATSAAQPRGLNGTPPAGAGRGQGSGGKGEADTKAPARSAEPSAPAASTGPATPATARAARPAAPATAPAATKPSPTKAARTTAPATPTGQDDDDQDSAELVHQLAQLQNDIPSPAPRPAAKPAAAAAAATAEETGQTDETGAEKGEEPLNRGLLLKFLNSVRS